MDALMAYGSGSEESDHGDQQQEEEQAISNEGGISGEIPGFFPIKKPITRLNRGTF
jgi:hypothetical protein